MSNQRLFAGLAVILAVVALVVMRSGKSEPDEPGNEAPAQGEAAATADSEPTKSAHGGKKKKAKAGRVRKVKHRPVMPGETRLSCPECNVIILSVDGLRADHMSLYGYDRKTTPSLDKFAKGAVVFEQAISQSSWKAPAIASMFTGVLPREHGVLYHPNPGSLSDKADTLAAHLSKAGYRTAGWHGGGYVTKSMGKGFDKWMSSGRTFKNNLESARDWLGQHGHERFFMFLQGYDMQKPFLQTELNTFHQPQGQYDMLSYCKRGNERVLTGDELQYVTAQYDASAVAVDKEISRFLNFLRDKKLLENSIVIVTAAHGEELFDHGGCDHGQTVYSELVHVPLLVHMPSKVAKRVAAPVAASISLKPTVLAMLGLTEGVDTSLDLRLVANGKGEQPAIVSETGSAVVDKADPNKTLKFVHYKAAVTAPDFKLVFQRKGDKDTWELYDTKADPSDKTDVAAKNVARVAKLKANLFPPKGAPAIPALPTLEKKGGEAKDGKAKDAKSAADKNADKGGDKPTKAAKTPKEPKATAPAPAP